MRRKYIIWLCAVPIVILVIYGVLLPTIIRWSAYYARQPDSKNWHRLEKDGFVIEYQGDIEKLARQLLPKIAKNYDPDYSSEMNLLIKNKPQVLRIVANQLGMDKPGKFVTDSFDLIADQVSDQYNALIPSGRYFRISNSPQKNSGAFRSKSAKITIDLSSLQNKTTNRDYGPPQPIYVFVTKKTTPDQVLNGLLEVRQTRVSNLAGSFCHEIAECSMCTDLKILSPFTRWLREGTSNYISARCLEEIVGKRSSIRFLNDCDTSGRKHLASQIDLLCWRNDKWAKEMPPPAGLDMNRYDAAHYPFATLEIQGLVDRHGPGVIPKIFKEISKSKLRDEETILNAIKKVTGEDFRIVLSKYGKNSKDRFKGLAVEKLLFWYVDVIGKSQLIKADEQTTTIPLIQDSKHGIGGIICCAAMKPPVNVKMELTLPYKGNSPKKVVTSTLKLTKKETHDARLWCGFEGSDYTLGDGAVKIYLNGKLLRTMKFKLVSPLQFGIERILDALWSIPQRTGRQIREICDKLNEHPS